MQIIEDTRNKTGKHNTKHLYWSDNGDFIHRCKLPVGDYARPPKISIDTKENMSEIAGNIGGKEHARFREECKLARDLGTHLIFLIENEDGIQSIEDVAGWKNPRRVYSPRCINGPRLQRAMLTMQERYGCEFLFCRPDQAAEIINKLLEQKDG